MQYFFEQAVLGIGEAILVVADLADSILLLGINYKWALLTAGVATAIILW